MPRKRGAEGTVVGLHADVAQAAFRDALQALRGEDGQGSALTRLQLRHLFEKDPNVGPDRADTMVHAFFRCVDPEPTALGQFRLPSYAEALVGHRDWRFSMTRMSLSDTMRLLALFRLGRECGYELTGGLAKFEGRALKALRGLGINPEEA